MKKIVPIFFLFGLFFLLTYKNPFNSRSLIPNLEPYPDSIFYSYPAWSLLNGSGFKMSLDDINIRNIVPPSYSLYLLPFLAIFRDIRVFYFANVILSLVSILLFYLIIGKLFNSKIIAFSLGLLLVSSYYFYSLSQYLMAENLTLALFLALILIFLKKISSKNIGIFSLLNILLLLTKLSNLPIFISLALIYFVKVLKSKNRKTLIKFILISVFVYFLGIGEIFLSGILKGREGFTGMVGFSFDYFKNNFRYYLQAISGKSGRFIWMPEKFITIDLVVLIFLGLIIGLLKRRRIFVFIVMSITFPLIIFMSFFYYPDTRYIYVLYPLFIASIGLLLETFKRKNILFLFLILLTVIDLGFVSIKNDFEARAITLKKQIGLNFRHAEEPWNYLAVQNFNQYFSQKSGKKYLATFLPVFYVDYFKNDNYEYLPISDKQEFPEYINIMCPNGINDCYQKILLSGGEIYLSRYYLSNNIGEWGKILDEIDEKYVLTKVSEGCHNTCDIYRLENRE